jgi:hypothetical protein
MIAIRITAGADAGQVHTYPGTVLPPWARTRVASGTAEIIQEQRAETAMLEPRSSAAVTEAQNPLPRRGAGGRFQPRR